MAGKKADGIAMLSAAAEAARKRHEQLNGDADAERAKIVAEKRKVEEILDNNTKLVREARDFLSDRESELRGLIASECQKCVENIRNGIRATIDQGVVGGAQLNKAFADYTNRGNEEVFNAIQPAFLEVSAEVMRMLSGLKGCSLHSENLKKSMNVRGGFSEKTKVHETYKLAGSIVGGAAGIFAGVKAGAAVGTFIGGPVGTAIGAAAGLATALLAGILGSACGSQMREIHLERQKESASTELFDAAAKFSAKLQKSYETAYASFSGELQDAIREWLRDQKDSVDKRYRKAVADLSKPAEEKAREAKSAEADAVRLDALKKELEAL